MKWFKDIFGFEETKENIAKYIRIENGKMFSSANNREFKLGELEVLSVRELRAKVTLLESTAAGTINISQIKGDISTIHRENTRGDLIQVASQFNLLEMISPNYTREEGISIYAEDRTQGPVCAMECAANTLYRNYFIDEVDTLSTVRLYLENKTRNTFWTMKNGYAMFSEVDLLKLNKIIEDHKEEIISHLKVGIVSNTEVLSTKETISQVYCSALPVSYHTIESKIFEEFATTILEATYEATILAAILNKRSNKVYLTMIGGGAFRNKKEWILNAIEKVFDKYKFYNLDIVFVNYSNPTDQDIVKLRNKFL